MVGGEFAPLYLASDITLASGGADTAAAAWPDPAHHVKIPPERTAVLVTGHYNDVAASTCRVFLDDALPGSLPSVDEAIMFCRRAFVVTDITDRR